MQVPGGHLPFGSWMPNAPYDLPPRANRPSIPVPCSKTKQHPIGMLFCFGKKGRESNPSNAGARWALAVRQLDAERSLRFAPKGKSAAGIRSPGRLGMAHTKAPSMAQLTTFILNRFIFFPPVFPVLGDQKSRAQLCGFCQLRNCAAARILIVSKIERKVRSFL